MFSIKQDGTLMCNRVGHNNKFIEALCMKKGCQEPIPCCKQCILKEHKNHQNNDFAEIQDLQGQVDSSLKYLTKLAQLSQSFCQICQQLNKSMLKLIDQLTQGRQLGQHPTLTELSNYAIRVRDRIVTQKEAELVKIFQSELQKIQMSLSTLQQDTNELLKHQVESNNQVNYQSVQSVVKKETLNLNHIQFTLTQKLNGHDNAVEFVSISNDDKYLASSQQSLPGIVILWDLKSNKSLTQYNTNYPSISAFQFSKDNSMLGVCCSEYYSFGFIDIYDLTNLENTQAKIRLEGHTNMINRITFTDDSNHLISASWDTSLRVWDLKQKKEINQQNCESVLNGVTYSNEKQLIACCDGIGSVYIFDCRTLNNLKLKIKWQAHSNESLYTEFIRNSTVLMTSSETETTFWKVDDLLKQIFNHFLEIKDGGWTLKAYPLDNPQVIINCSSDGQFVNLWNYNSTGLIQRLEIPDGMQYTGSFAITSDFRKIITAGNNKMVNIFEQR